MSKTAPIIANALHYSVAAHAPQVIAQGKGDVAEKILKLAALHGIEVVKNDALAEYLYTLDVGREIPERLYHIVAEILAVVYAKENR